MLKVYAMLADGLEETECLAVVDILKRGGIDVNLISIKEDSLEIKSSHNIKIICDYTINEIDLNASDLIFLPGGMPGSKKLYESNVLKDAISNQLNNNKRVAAICAAPAVVLGQHGFLKNKKATCYPGFENLLKGATYTNQGVITDGLITTARGLGFAIDLGLELLSLLVTNEISEKIKESIQYR